MVNDAAEIIAMLQIFTAKELKAEEEADEQREKERAEHWEEQRKVLNIQE